MKDSISILSTRPIDGALIEKAAYQNITIDTLTFIKVEKIVIDEVAAQIAILSRQAATVVFTSINAVEIVVETMPADAVMPDWKIYCIGGATFTLVKKYWAYESLIYTAKTATELAEKITSDKVPSVTFFCGNKRREELPGLLRNENITVNELVVYETIETPVKTDKKYDGILFFSPSAVTSFFTENKPSQDTTLFAIGKTTANTLKEFCLNNIIISEFPAKDQLVDKAIEFYNNE